MTIDPAMFPPPYSFELEFRSLDDGRTIGRRGFEPNWEPACEWTRLVALRRSAGGLEGAIETVVDVIGHPTSGLPHAAGFRVVLRGPGGVLESCEFGVRYFNSQARAFQTSLIRDGELKAGDLFGFRLLAMPRPAPASSAKPAFSVTEEPPQLITKPASLDILARDARPHDEQNVGDLPVFIPQHVLDETAALTVEAGAVETGGILIGHIVRDESVRDLGVVVTAQIPAHHAEREAQKLTFTAATWSAVQAAIALRRSDEAYLGWWHSHPAKYWCSPECPPERRRECPFAQSFLSDDDTNLHANIFPPAHMLALLVTHADAGLTHALFGWHEGVIRRRGFLASSSTHRPDTAFDSSAKEVSHAQIRT